MKYDLQLKGSIVLRLIKMLVLSKAASLPESWCGSDFGQTVQQRQDVEENVELKIRKRFIFYSEFFSIEHFTRKKITPQEIYVFLEILFG